MLIEYILESSMNANPNDIFYKPNDAIEWQRLYNRHYVQIEAKTGKDFEKKFNELKRTILNFMAAASEELEESKASWNTMITIGAKALYYKMFSSEGNCRSEQYFSNPNPVVSTNLMSIIDSKYTYPFMKLILPKIKYHQVIYIPKLLPRLTIENITEEDDFHNFIPTIDQSEDITNIIKRFKNFINPFVKYTTKKLEPVPDTHVKVRILSQNSLNNEDKKGNIRFENILIDIHGGGFIATTSRCHQTYLRKWAKNCNVVIFAIDYKLAPKVKYPYILDEIWQAYFWIITQCTTELGIVPKKILFAGDSAGGNLAMSLTLRCIKVKFRIPDGILLGYPALNLSIRSFTPSLLNAMDDFLLRYSFLNICINSYIPDNGDPEHDPYLSPSLISDEELSKFPPIKIMSAGRDTLRDESYKLTERLARLNKDVELIEYRKLPHGFWNFDASFGLEECSISTEKAMQWIKSLLINNI